MGDWDWGIRSISEWKHVISEDQHFRDTKLMVLGLCNEQARTDNGESGHLVHADHRHTFADGSIAAPPPGPPIQRQQPALPRVNRTLWADVLDRGRSAEDVPGEPPLVSSLSESSL